MLPAPNLDDRTFQGLVDEAKRSAQFELQKADGEWALFRRAASPPGGR